MGYIIRYADDAIDDLREIRTWYDEISSALTGKFKIGFIRTEKDIFTNPLAFSKTGYKDFGGRSSENFHTKWFFV